MDHDELLEKYEQLKKSELHYRVLLDESMDPTFSFFSDGTYRYVNKAFADGVGKTKFEIIGKTIWDIFKKEEADKRFRIVEKVFNEGKTLEIEVCVPIPTGDTYYLTTAKPIFDSSGLVETVICTSKNITERKKAEIALKKEHDQLLKALNEIKVLSGFLPICAACKKIRDDSGYWNQIEEYIEKHTDTQFSHSICPDCTKEMYPEIDID